jgi:hypothetical protein
MDLHALGVMRNFTAMFEMDSEVGATRLGSLFWDFGFDAVTDHDCKYGID